MNLTLNSRGRCFGLPGRGAVPVQYVEVLAAEQFASIDARLDGSESTQNPNLFDIAHQRHYIEPLELRVDGVQATDEVLEKELERLRQAEHRVPCDDERGHLLPAIIDQFALVRRWIAGADRWRAVVRPRWQNGVMGSHELERRAMVTAEHAAELPQQPQTRWR